MATRYSQARNEDRPWNASRCRHARSRPGLPREVALVPLVWVHVWRIVGGTILAPGAVDAGVPTDFRVMVGLGDLATAVLALLALIALRACSSGALALVWLFVVVGLLDTLNAIVQSMRVSVFNYPLGVNWVIVAIYYVPALLVSSCLIFVQLLGSARGGRSAVTGRRVERM